MWISTHRLRERVLAHGSLNHFHGSFLQGFPWPIIFLCLVLSPCWVYLRVIPAVRMHLWEGWHHLLWGGTPSLLGPQGAFLCMCSWKGLPDVENKGYVVSLSSVWAGLSSSLPLRVFSSSWSICPQEQILTVQLGAHLPPDSRLLKWQNENGL